MGEDACGGEGEGLTLGNPNIEAGQAAAVAAVKARAERNVRFGVALAAGGHFSGSGEDYLGLFGRRSRSRTPGPPPFSSMNSTPANSRTSWSAAIVGRFAVNSPGLASSRLIVASETFEASEGHKY
jgi:hypothetical protein